MKRVLVGLAIAGVSVSAVPRAAAEGRSLESMVRETVKRAAPLRPQDAAVKAPKRIRC